MLQARRPPAGMSLLQAAGCSFCEMVHMRPLLTHACKKVLCPSCLPAVAVLPVVICGDWYIADCLWPGALSWNVSCLGFCLGILAFQGLALDLIHQD